MKRYGVRLACLIVLVLGVLWLAWQGVQNRLTIVNQSGQVIPAVKITIADETLNFAHLRDGQEVASPFQIKNEDRIMLVGRLADGTIIKGNYRYISNGSLGERAKFTIKRNGAIEFEQK